jgi:hypothetical protein
MTTSIIKILCYGCGLILLGFNQTSTAAPIIQDPYVAALRTGQATSAVYMHIINPDRKRHVIIEVTSPAARTAVLQTVVFKNDTRRVQQLEQLELPAQSTTLLTPETVYIVLSDLQQVLSPGDNIKLTLHYQDGSSHEITAPIQLTAHFHHYNNTRSPSRLLTE